MSASKRAVFEGKMCLVSTNGAMLHYGYVRKHEKYRHGTRAPLEIISGFKSKITCQTGMGAI